MKDLEKKLNQMHKILRSTSESRLMEDICKIDDKDVLFKKENHLHTVKVDCCGTCKYAVPCSINDCYVCCMLMNYEANTLLTICDKYEKTNNDDLMIF